MKNKYIFRTLVLLTAAGAFLTSCKFEEEDAFSESASLRVEHTNQSIQNELCAASENGGYGWVIQYYVGGTDDFKAVGYNLFGTFNRDNSVTLSSDHPYLRGGRAGKFTSDTSVYELLAEDGPVLAFNTWNDVLTVFVDPVDPTQAPKTIVSDGTGMNGDQNLVMLTHSATEMNFRGERHSAPVHFVKLDRPAEQYATDAANLEASLNNVVSNPYIVTDGTTTGYILGLNNGVMNIYERVVDPLYTDYSPLCFTPNGFRLKKEFSAFEGALKFTEFVYNADRQCFVETSNSNVTIDVAYKTAAEAFIKGMSVKMYTSDVSKIWNFDANSDLSDNLKADIAAIKSAYTSLKSHKFYFSYDTTNKKISVTLQCKFSTQTKRYTYNFDYTYSNGTFTLSNPTLTKEMDSQGKKIQTQLEAFMADLAKSFTAVDTDSKWTRSTMKIQTTDGSTYLNLN